MVTIKKISAELNLSPATVSRAMNGFPEVSEKTRRLVEETARRLNYQPNQLAKKLATGRSGMIGLVLPHSPENSFDPTFYDVMTALSRRMTELDLDLLFHASVLEDELEPYRRLVGKQAVDGFIITSPKLEDARVAFLTERKVPFVVHGRTATPQPDYPYFDIDNFKVGRDSADLLLDLGHRRILFIDGPDDTHFSDQRRRGFFEAFSARGLDAPTLAVRHGRMTETFGYSTALSALADDRRGAPTAFICASTIVAAGVYKAIGDKGLRVGNDISVVAHDDAAPQMRAVSFNPALTVTRSPMRDACGPLADFLQGLFDSRDLHELQRTEAAELIVRQSTGPVPAGGDSPW